jgi:hypothetical protein
MILILLIWLLGDINMNPSTLMQNIITVNSRDQIYLL